MQVQLVFQITKDFRDEEFMNSLISNFNCGRVRLRKYKKDSTDHCMDFLVTSFADIDQKIIPFFKEYKVHGVKLYDFKD